SFGFWLVIPSMAMAVSMRYVPEKLVSHAMNLIVGLEIEEKIGTKLATKLWRCNNWKVRFSDKDPNVFEPFYDSRAEGTNC
ncbi:MAG: hypothetical protein ACOVQM_16455, partial [Pirellula sp.]